MRLAIALPRQTARPYRYAEPTVQRERADCEEEKTPQLVQRATPGVQRAQEFRTAQVRDAQEIAAGAVAHAAQGSRGPLPRRQLAERAVGADLSGVTALTGEAATRACADLGAEAFTVGTTATFGSQDPDPATVIHEATHAVQQAHASGGSRGRLPILNRGQAAENEAGAYESGSRAGARTATPIALKQAVTWHQACIHKGPWIAGAPEAASGLPDSSPRLVLT
jgi:uncharacterized protein DUF4157